ncbi:MAG: hypothetical protein E7070_03250 [Bacteroidales bacterium]|nr:hypothetical protein [Bacteroidales bacterium]
MKQKILSILALFCLTTVGAWAGGVTVTFYYDGMSKTIENVTLPHTYSCNADHNGELDKIIQEVCWVSNNAYCISESPTISGNKAVAGMNNGNLYITLKRGFTGPASLDVMYHEDMDGGWSESGVSLQVSATVDPDATDDGYELSAGTSPHGTIAFTVDGKAADTAHEDDEVTVTITPDEGWAAGLISGEWRAAEALAPAMRNEIDPNIQLLDAFVLDPVEGLENTYRFTMQRAHVEISAEYRKLLTHSDMSVGTIGSKTYTGLAITPDVVVKDGTTVLTRGTDYTIAYENNLNAGTAKATVIGIGKYAGNVERNFVIDKANIAVTAPAPKVLTYNGAEQTLINAGVAVGGEMQYSLDGTTFDAALPQGTTSGSYTIFYRVVADANHIDVPATFINVPIFKAPLTAVLFTESNLVYNQQEQSPEVSAVKSGNLTVPAADYTVSGSATNVGTYTLTATALDEAQNFTGQISAQFSIVSAGASLFTLSLDPTSLVYDGTALQPAVTVKDGATVLTEGKDYTLAYTNNVNVGTATVTATGTGNYTGTKTAQFAITKANITVTAPVAKEGLVYTTQPQMLVAPASASAGEVQYSLDGQSWSTSVPTGIDAKTYTVHYRVVADANHNDVAESTVNVTIDKAELTAAALAESNFIYNQQPQTAPVVFVGAGTIVVPADSYDVTGNTATTVGTYTATVTGKGNFKGTATAQFSIVAANANVFDMTLTQDSYIYDGQAKIPGVTVKDGEAVLVEGTDYTLAYTANVNAGTAIVTATGKGNYTGTASKTYAIEPAKLTAVSLANTEFVYNVFAPVAQTATVATVMAGDIEVPDTQYEVVGNTQTEAGTYTVAVTGKTNFAGSVTAEFVIKDQTIDGTIGTDESGTGISGQMVISVVDRINKWLRIDRILQPTSTEGEKVTVIIPAQIDGWDVTELGEGAMDGMDNVTDIYLPDTEEPIQIGEGAFPSLATIHTSLALLDDYALMITLKSNYEATKVLTTVTLVNKYWTLGTGCDVVIPEGIDAYTVQAKNSAEVATEIIPEELLNMGGERIIKANNGVLLLGEAGKSYDLYAYCGRLASGMPISTADNKDYGRSNCLEPVVERSHYERGHYFVLVNNQFHSILAEGADVKVPAGKAVLHLGESQAGANAAMLRISVEETSGIETIGQTDSEPASATFDLLGRVADPSVKGFRITNRKIMLAK